MAHDEHVMELRGTMMRGLVQSVNDTGETQTVTVVTHDGMVRSDIEVWQPFGHATYFGEGSVVMLWAVGADPGDLVATAPMVPGARYGNLAPGESVLYGADGSRCAIRQGGTIDVFAATLVNVLSPTVNITASAGVNILGNVNVVGTVSVTDDVVAGSEGSGVSLLNHTHGGVTPGGGSTAPPTPGT